MAYFFNNGLLTGLGTGVVTSAIGLAYCSFSAGNSKLPADILLTSIAMAISGLTWATTPRRFAAKDTYAGVMLGIAAAMMLETTLSTITGNSCRATFR